MSNDKTNRHCWDHLCTDSYRMGGCECGCEVCWFTATGERKLGAEGCAVGCPCASKPSGFVPTGAVGVWLGQGAGYMLVKSPTRWRVLDPNGLEIEPHPKADTMDEANSLATKHARAAGHAHP